MGGPWENYAQADSGDNAPAGPWQKYGGGDSGSGGGLDTNAAIQGFGNMATAGYLPELTSAAGRLMPDPTADSDAQLRAQGFTLKQDDSTGVTTDQSRSMQKQMASDSPYSYYGGGAAGAIATAPAYGAALKAVGIAKTAPQVAAAADAGLFTRAGVYAQNLGSRALQAAKEGAAIGAVANPNTEEGQSGLNVGGRILNAGAGGALSAAIPAVGDAVKAGAGTAQDATQWGATKLLSSLGGVKPDVIKEYAQFADRINAAPSVDALKETSDQFVGKLAADVDAKKVSMGEAQNALDGFQSDLKDAYKTAGYDARDAVTSAKQTLGDAHDARIQQVSSDVYDTINQLKSDVQQGSKNAIKTLDNATGKVDLAPVYGSIDDSISRLNKQGTDEALAVADKLQDYKSRLMTKNWSQIAPQDAKQLIQGLDQITEYSPMAGSFDKAKNVAFKGVRSALDQSLKDSVPAYRTAMEPVAADAQLLNQVSPFGDKQRSAGILQRIDAPSQADNKTALVQLGQRYGLDFTNAAKPESLPEYAQLQKAQGALEAIRPDKVAAKIEQTVGASRQQAQLGAAQSQYAAAQGKLAPFKSLAPNSADQTQAQQKLMQLAKGKNIDLEDMFTKLGKLTDTDFVQAMKDHNTQAAFQKGATNGSRNTLMGALTGFIVGGPTGAAAGGAAGRAVDQWGPAVTKKILDGAIAVSKNPTVSTISNLSIPETAKRAMVVQLENYMAQSRLPTTLSAQRDTVKQNRSPAVGEDKWAQTGLSKLGITDPGIAGRLMSDRNARQLLIRASDLPPGSAAMKNIQNQIQKGLAK